MKSVIIFYSYSGNTRRVAQILTQQLQGKGEVSVVEIKPREELHSFLGQAKQAFFKKRTEINEVNFDLSGYDLICFGSPVWAFAPAAAMNTYLDKCIGVAGKEIILFTTYGSGTGNQRCLNYMQGILAKKGVRSFGKFSIQQGRVWDRDFVVLQIKELARLWPNG